MTPPSFSGAVQAVTDTGTYLIGTLMGAAPFLLGVAAIGIVFGLIRHALKMKK